MGHKGYGVPFVVKIRTFLFHAIIALIVLVVDVFVFQFLAENATYACSEIKRANDAPHSEIVFSYERTGEESFYYLKQHHVVGAKNINVNCDILMVLPDAEYKNNDIYFSGTLENGSCVVSANLAKQYGLNVGDRAKIVGTDTAFKIVGMLTAQSGLDKEYLHEGIIVTAYDGNMLDKQYSFISFTTDGDAYPSLISLVYIKDWKAESTNKILIYAAVAVAAFGLAMGVCERFLFSSRRRDYRILVGMGATKKRMLFYVWAENAVKYIFPSLLAAAIYSGGLSAFGAMYALPALFPSAVGILAVTVYSLLIIWRLFKCQAKAKQ